MDNRTFFVESDSTNAEILDDLVMPNYTSIDIEHTAKTDHIHSGFGACSECNCPRFVQAVSGMLCDRPGCGHFAEDHR